MSSASQMGSGRGSVSASTTGVSADEPWLASSASSMRTSMSSRGAPSASLRSSETRETQPRVLTLASGDSAMSTSVSGFRKGNDVESRNPSSVGKARARTT